MDDNRRVVWAPKARSDLGDIWRYYARVTSPDIADKLLREIDIAGKRLGKETLIWRARDEVLPGLRCVLVHPHTIFYHLKGHDVEIARVLNERRNFPAIFSKRKR